MKSKIAIMCICIIAFITSIVVAARFSRREVTAEKQNDNIQISELIEDECTEEYINSQKEEIEQVNVKEEKITANTEMILKKYYKKCEHTLNEVVELPVELVNMTEKELQEQYKDWEVIGFSQNKIILYKELDCECGEHFKLKIEDDKIVIYKKEENGEEKLYQKTDISSEYLTEADLINMEAGLEIFGKEELNKIIEDFE